MKKQIAMVVILTALLFSSSGLAKEYYTIEEVYAQSLGGLHKIYSAYDRQITVDVDFVVPNVNKFPVEKVKRTILNGFEASNDLPFEVKSVYGSQSGMCGRYIMKNGFDYPKEIECLPKKVYSYPFEMNLPYAPNNTLTLYDATSILKDKLNLVKIETDNFDFENLYDFSTFEYLRKETGEVAMPGSYTFSLYQVLNDIPIITNIGRAYNENTTESYYPFIRFNVRAENSWQLIMDTLVSDERIAEDVPLCDISTIIASIENEIYSGHIRKIYEVMLGYVVYDNKDMQKPRGQINEDYYIVPGWMVNCIYMDDPEREHTYSSDVFERHTKEYASLVFNAQTGKMTSRKYNKKDKADYAGFISWDDVER